MWEEEYGTLSISNSMMAEESASQNNTCSIYLLGKTYHPILDYATRRSDERSLFWFTYRCDFPMIVPYGITTDAGWGCMLRSAQMMLAQVLRLHYKGREWHPPQSIVQRRADPFYCSILTWFADHPSHRDYCRYSLHNMVATGLSRYETLPGEWYGPGTACYVLRDLCRLHEQHREKAEANLSTGQNSKIEISGPMFRVYIASQGSVYKDAVEDLMTRDGQQRKAMDINQNSSKTQYLPSHPLDPEYQEKEEVMLAWDTALLVLIPLRLGLKSLNETYATALAHVFSLRQSVGALGGRPRGARWFYGATSDGAKLYGLDPHTVQSAPQLQKARNSKTVVALTEEYMRSVHCRSPDVIQMQRMDPSLALGFYCRSRADFDDLCSSMKQWRESHASERSMPDLFAVADAVPDYSANVSSVMNEMLLSTSCGEVEGLDSNTNDFLIEDGDQADLSDDDEYVML